MRPETSPLSDPISKIHGPLAAIARHLKSQMNVDFSKASLNLKQLRTVTVMLAISVLCAAAPAQPVIKVAQSAWSTLNPSERDLIQKSYVVSMVPQDSFGLIIDNQGVNESTGGTNVGAALGGAIANAAYVDNAIRGGNYSAVNQLAAGILGAMVGSTLDSKAKAQYHYRYAVKFSNGNIQYFDEVSSEAFRHPAGVCVSVPNVALTDQQLCSQTADSLRMAYLRQQTAPPQFPAPVLQVVPPPVIAASGPATSFAVQADVGAPPPIINCKLGTLAPVPTTPEKCELIKGSQVR